MHELSVSEQAERKLLHALAQFKDALVLDIGAGDGRFVAHYGAQAAFIHLIDLDIDDLADARQLLGDAGVTRYGLHNTTAERLPFPSEHFDLAVFSWSL